MSKSKYRFKRARRGAAAVEFAAVLPLISLLLLGAIEGSHTVLVQHALVEAAESGCRLYASADCGGENQRLQVKYSKVINAQELDEAAFLRVANAFRDAGYGDVAWKITPIDPDDPDPESTTASFPVELFQSCLEEDALEDEAGVDIPPEPFGSEAFWKWFDKADN